MNIKAWTFTLFFIAVVIGGAFYVKKDILMPNDAASQPAFEPAATVKAITLSAVRYQDTSQINGQIKAPYQLQLKNELAGKIIGLNLPSGAKVNKGDVIVKLDTRTEQANLMSAKAQLALSEQTLARYKKLVKRNEISADAVDRAEADYAMANAQVLLLEAAIDKKVISAPFNAVVGLHNLAIGQFLDKNTDIVELVGAEKYNWVEFSLPQSFPELQLNEQVVMESFDGKQRVNVTVIAINPVLSTASRHLKYRAQFLLSDFSVKPNTLVNVIVPVNHAEQLIAIPDLALTHDQFGDYVYLLTPESEGSYRAKRSVVTTSGKKQGQVFIAEGVNAGDLIATEGAFKLRDGMKVYIQATKELEQGSPKPATSNNEPQS